MRRISIGFVAVALLAAAPAAWGQSALKIAYVDSEAIVRQAPGYAEASEQFNQAVAGWQDTLEQTRQRLQELYEDYKRQEAVLSDEKKAERQQEILRLEREAQEYFQVKLGPEGEATARQAELMRPILERVNRAIDEIRAQEGYSLIFDLNAPGLVAGDPTLNITDRVIQRMNQQAAAPGR